MVVFLITLSAQHDVSLDSESKHANVMLSVPSTQSTHRSRL